jgi:hypothetical protein
VHAANREVHSQMVGHGERVSQKFLSATFSPPRCENMPRLELLCYPKMHGKNVRLGKRYLGFLIGTDFSLPKKIMLPISSLHPMRS